MTDAAKALVAAQKAMGKAHKGSNNPHFRSRYASLGDVMDACYPALHDNGFAVIQPQGKDDFGAYVETVFAHESGTEYRTRVYLLVEKPTMQGMGSAITYARRYGLIALAGIADTDDDANAASAPRKQEESPAPDEHFAQAVVQVQREIYGFLEGGKTAADLRTYWQAQKQAMPEVMRDEGVKKAAAEVGAQLKQREAEE